MSNMYQHEGDDGFIIFYVKDAEVYPIVLSKDELEFLGFVIGGAFDRPVRLYPKSIGTVQSLGKK